MVMEAGLCGRRGAEILELVAALEDNRCARPWPLARAAQREQVPANDDGGIWEGRYPAGGGGGLGELQVRIWGRSLLGRGAQSIWRAVESGSALRQGGLAVVR
jgi:hypothetical protein